MQDALQTAVNRMNSGDTEPSSPSIAPDPLGLIMTILPKLMQGRDEDSGGDEVMEKLDGLQKGDLAALRDQVQILRKQCHRILKSQDEIRAELREMQHQQSTATQAVLALAQQLLRLEIVDSVPGPPLADDDLNVPVMSASAIVNGRHDAAGRERRTQPKSPKNITRARS
jgi:hypothetical protein